VKWHGIIETYEVKILIVVEISCVRRLVIFLIVAILFKVHFIQKMGSLCRGTHFRVNVEYFLCTE